MDGDKDYRPLVDFADVLLIAGANPVNGKADKIFELSKDKPYYFFGTTAAGLARSMICPGCAP